MPAQYGLTVHAKFAAQDGRKASDAALAGSRFLPVLYVSAAEAGYST